MGTGWIRRLGPGIAAIGAVAAIASTTSGAPPPGWLPPGCPGAPVIGGAKPGTWFRLDPIVANGTYLGQHLSIGDGSNSVVRRLDLAAESFASGPLDGKLLVGTDDGGTSSLSLIDIVAGCQWSLGTSSDVVRGALIDPAGRSVVESRVDRRTRADLGVWRRPLDGGSPTRLLGPISADARFGPTWRTELAWAADGATLIIASCGEVSCRYRLLGPAGVTTLADPAVGSLVGLADGWLVTRGACRGLPCPIVSTAIGVDGQVTLAGAADGAVLAEDGAGRPIVVHELGEGGHDLVAVRPDGRDRRALPGAPGGLRLVAGPSWSGTGMEGPPDRLLFGPEGRLPLDGTRRAALRLSDPPSTVTLDEVPR